MKYDPYPMTDARRQTCGLIPCDRRLSALQRYEDMSWCMIRY